jgi:hypothetical protein
VTRGGATGRGLPGRRRSARAFRWWATTLVCVALSLPAIALAQSSEDSALERRVKAAFIYQFIPYVEWPPKAFPDAETPIVVSVVGSEQAVGELQEVIGKRSAQGRPLLVRRWRDSDAQGGPHVVYVTRSHADRLPAVARAAQANGMLVVSEQETGLDQGGMINFRLVDGKVRFDVALGPAERAGLRISSRLLAVAQTVRSAS